MGGIIDNVNSSPKAHEVKLSKYGKKRLMEILKAEFEKLSDLLERSGEKRHLIKKDGAKITERLANTSTNSSAALMAFSKASIFSIKRPRYCSPPPHPLSTKIKNLHPHLPPKFIAMNLHSFPLSLGSLCAKTTFKQREEVIGEIEKVIGKIDRLLTTLGYPTTPMDRERIERAPKNARLDIKADVMFPRLVRFVSENGDEFGYKVIKSTE